MFFKKLKKEERLAIVTVIAVFILSFVICFSVYKNTAVVGYVTDNKIYYDDKVYAETHDVFDFEVGNFLGVVKWTDLESRSRIYKIKNHPEYIYLSMGWDYRIYKIIDDNITE